MHKSKLIIWAVFVALFIYSACAHAYVLTPIVLTKAEQTSPMWVRSGFSLLVPTSPTTNLPSLGNASSTSITRNMIAKVGSFGGIVTAGTIAVSSYIAWVDAHPADFPLSYRLLHPELPINQYPVGSVMLDKYGVRVKITGSSYILSQTCGVVDNSLYPSYSSGVLRVGWSGGSFTCSTGSPSSLIGYPAVPTTDPLTGLTTTVSSDNFSQSLNNVYPSAVPEIDKFLNQNPNAVSLPSDLSSQISNAKETLDSANRDTDGDGITDANDDDIDGDGLPNAEDSDANGDGTPDDQEPKEEEESIEIDNPEVPDIKSIDLSPLKNIGTVLVGKFPFSLLSTVKELTSSFVSSPKTPQFTIHFPQPFDFDWNISLSRWDSWAALFRFIVGAAFLVLVSMNILRRWV